MLAVQVDMRFQRLQSRSELKNDDPWLMLLSTLQIHILASVCIGPVHEVGICAIVTSNFPVWITNSFILSKKGQDNIDCSTNLVLCTEMITSVFSLSHGELDTVLSESFAESGLVYLQNANVWRKYLVSPNLVG